METQIPDNLLRGSLPHISKVVSLIGLPGSIKKFNRGALVAKVDASGNYDHYDSASITGLQIPRGVILEDKIIDDSAIKLASIYIMGEFNANAIIVANGVYADVQNACESSNLYLELPSGETVWNHQEPEAPVAK